VKITGANQWRPHLHVQDAAEAFVRSTEVERTPGVSIYNVGENAQNFTIAEIAAKVLEYLPETVVEYADGAQDRRSYRVSFDHIREQFGFTPTYSVDDAIREVCEVLTKGNIPDYRASVYHNVKHLEANGVRRSSL
jgi:nucleoside-diphosphate-sugar epimerase